MIRDSTVLVTGGTGSIGSEIVKGLISRGAKKILVFSRDDTKQFYFRQELGKRSCVEFMIGDVRDKDSLGRAFQFDFDIVIHAAAMKHVEISENNPTEVVKTNILGTQNLIDLAKESSAKVLMTVSTDKAVSPSSIMGASKFIAEKLTIDGNNNGGTKLSCVRFGNVMGSRGSVIPTFIDGIKNRGSIWVSDTEVTRFAMPIVEAADLVLDAVELSLGGEIFVLKMKAFSMGQLLRVFEKMPFASGGFEIETRGRIDAEKLHEELFTIEESSRLWETEKHYIISNNDEIPDYPGLKKSKSNNFSSENAERYSDQELIDIISSIADSILVD